MHILTAKEFIAQGTSAGAIMSIAASNPAARTKLEAVAREVAAQTGQSLQVPGAITIERMQRTANDNRRGRRVA